MKRAKVIRWAMMAVALVGCSFPQWALSAESTAPSSVPDVQLRGGHMLVGQIVNPQNVPCVDMPVSVCSHQQPLAVARTDSNGYFAFSGMRSGAYEIATADGQTPVRVWTPETAPPAAQPGILLVNQRPAALGQHCTGGGLRSALANPLVIGGVVATAIAVPVVIHNSNDNGPSSP